MDLIFSFDSILTAVGLIDEVIMIIAVTIALVRFHVKVPKGCIYFAVFFSLVVEIINMRMRRNATANTVELNAD